MSSPSTRIAPAVGSSSRTSMRATVDLPQPDSPDEAEGLAVPEGEAHAVDRVHDAAVAGGELLDQVDDVEDRVRHEVAVHDSSPARMQALR